MTSNPVEIMSGAVAPVECLKSGWALIKNQYWLFLGIVLLGMFIGGAVPVVLFGPMMCGVYLCIFRKMRGERVEFGGLFKGFDYFLQSLIAAALHVLPMLAVMVPAYAILFIMIISSAPRNRAEQSDFLFTIVAFELVFMIVILVVSLIVGIFFMFPYALIVDRGLSGVEAVKTSIKAGMANFGGILGLLLLNLGLVLVGVLFCYVGAFLTMPVSIASYAVAYRKVFGESPANLASPPPPPASWAA